MVKNPPANAGDAGDMGLTPEVERSSWRRRWHPTPVFLPGKSHGQRSLVGCNPWSHKELDKTEHTHILYYFKRIVTYVMKKTQLNIFAIHFH